MTSNFFCLMSKELFSNNSKVRSYDCNLLKDTYDIKFQCCTYNDFIRNIEGIGQIYSNEKLKIKLTGKGKLKNFINEELIFFSSELVTEFDKNRESWLTFEKNDKFYYKFEKHWLNFFKKSQKEEKNTENEIDNKLMMVPALNVLLISKIIKSDSWNLELMEK